MNPKVIVSRMKKEIERLETDPPPGVMCWPKGDTVLDLEAGACDRPKCSNFAIRLPYSIIKSWRRDILEGDTWLNSPAKSK